jgi:hypothetical protein
VVHTLTSRPTLSQMLSTWFTTRAWTICWYIHRMLVFPLEAKKERMKWGARFDLVEHGAYLL